MKKINVILFISGLFVLSSCQEWLDINSDPSFPQEAPAEVLLPPIFQEMLRGEAFDSRFFGCYVQNWANTSASTPSTATSVVTDLHGYQPLSDNLGEKWRQHYWAIGKNIDLMIEEGTAKGKWWYVGAAYAIRAWSWQTSTDVYGEMILNQAWEPNRYVFDYDTQDLIYAEVVRLCNLALENLDKEDVTATFSKGDLAYGGDPVKWKKFVNAILARNAHHISNKTSIYNPDAVIAFVDAAMASNADNFNVPHLGTNTDNANFYGALRGNIGAYRQADFSVRLVRGGATDIFPLVVDPRMSLMFQPSGDALYRGLTNGSGNTFGTGAQAIPAAYGKYIFNNNTPVPLFTFAEMQFIKAEAAFQKGDLTTALAAYQNGIRAHMDYVGVSVVNRETYLSSSAVAQTTGALTLSRIMLQKYIAMYGHGILETWVDMRRHHYSSAVYTGFTLPANLASTNNGLPAYRARPRYNSEYVWNIKAIEAIGGTNLDYHTYEPWFSKP